VSEQQTDAEILMEDSATTATIAGEKYAVKALPIRRSIAWTKAVTKYITERGVAAARMQAAKTEAEQIEALREVTASSEIEAVLEWVLSHGSIPAEAVENASAAEVIDAFGVLWKIENPTSGLQAILTKRR